MLALPRGRKNKASSCVFSMSKRGVQRVFGGPPVQSVSPRENAFFARRLPTKYAWTRTARLFQRNAAHRGLRLFFNLRFAVRAAAPPCERKAGFDTFLEFAKVGRLHRVRLAELESAVMERLLNLLE
jgi:hypothetical protein